MKPAPAAPRSRGDQGRTRWSLLLAAALGLIPCLAGFSNRAAFAAPQPLVPAPRRLPPPSPDLLRSLNGLQKDLEALERTDGHVVRARVSRVAGNGWRLPRLADIRAGSGPDGWWWTELALKVPSTSS